MVTDGCGDLGHRDRGGRVDGGRKDAPSTNGMPQSRSTISCCSIPIPSCRPSSGLLLARDGNSPTCGGHDNSSTAG